MSADVEKTRQQLALREKEANEKLAHWRQLEHQLNRLESQLKEAELDPQRGEGGDGGTTGRQKLRELTKQRSGLQLQVANARFDHEDAAERVKAAQRDLEKAEFAAAQARLADLARRRMELADKINSVMDTVEQQLEAYDAIVTEQQKLAKQLGIEEDSLPVETGPILRIARLLETQDTGPRSGGQ